MQKIITKAYFNADIKPKIIELLQTAKSEVFVASAWFNDNELYDALLSLPRNVKTNILIKKDEDTNSLNWKALGDNNIGVYQQIEEKGVRSLIHHKFCTIDSSIVITGSYNWTNGANSHNFENVVVIEGDNGLNFQYKEEFKKLIQPILDWLEEETKLLSEKANEHIEEVKAKTEAHISKVKKAEEEIIDYMDKYKEKPLGKLKFTQDAEEAATSDFGNGVVVRSENTGSSIKKLTSELSYKTIEERKKWWSSLSSDLKYFFNERILDKGKKNYNYPGDVAIQNILLLKEVDCSYRDISNMDGIEGLTHLKVLKINNNKLWSLNNIFILSNLEELICYDNSIDDKLNGLYFLEKLKKLECYSNKLGTLKGIEELPNLIHIKCSNKFKKMPLELLRLENSGFKNTSNYSHHSSWTR
jgi:hypothetical protein